MNKLVRFVMYEAALLAGIYVLKTYGKNLENYLNFLKKKDVDDEASVEKVQEVIKKVENSESFKAVEKTEKEVVKSVPVTVKKVVDTEKKEEKKIEYAPVKVEKPVPKAALVKKASKAAPKKVEKKIEQTKEEKVTVEEATKKETKKD